MASRKEIEAVASTSAAAAATTAAELAQDAELESIASVQEYLYKNHIILLDYEKQMFEDLMHLDGLLVTAKGLYYDRVLLNILRIYSDAGNLILVINFSDWEEEYYKSKLERKYVHDIANLATDRERKYLEGGVHFISTRVLVVDLLKQRIPIELITGIVVLRAHTIIESCQEAFALRLYRQSNKTGFIKAFSNNVEAFTIGYSHIERTMRNLFVKELFVWPRFHVAVQRTLRPYQIQTVELSVPMPYKMKMLQTHILDIMNYLVRELKRINRSVDMEEITVENCVTKNFHKILQAQLDCIWHQLNSQTKLIIADLRILRNLMIATMYNDAISAYELIKRYRTTEYVHKNSGWTLLEAAEQIFKLSKQRVYNDQGEFEPEACPKWRFLAEILQVEIPADMQQRNVKSVRPPKVLILCQDRRSCFELKQFLLTGGERYFLYTAMRHQIAVGKLSKRYEQLGSGKQIFDAALSQPQTANKHDVPAVAEHAAEATDELMQLLMADDAQANELQFEESYMLTMTQLPAANETEVAEHTESEAAAAAADAVLETSIFEPFPELDNMNINAAIEECKQPLICIQTFKSDREGAMCLERMLEEVQPHYVIMYHCNITAVRQLEIFEARQRRTLAERMKVYFLMHSRTVEEQAYLTSLRREKQAFELIIETRSKMVIPEWQDGKTDEAFILYKDYADLNAEDNENTRKAGGQAQGASTAGAAKIIVDMREFRSDLPCLIHKRGIEVLPVTITIGDYILTPDICVERKSISDLIGSLNSGRLYNQCIQMQRFYAKPILLIEFDQNKPFHLQGKYMLSQNTNNSNADIVQKLQLLTVHFPKLRLIWSPSPYATAQLFEELKMGKPEPDAKHAAAVGSEDAGAYSELKYNANVHDFLLRLPGVNTRNIHQLMRQGGSLKQLLKLSQTELSAILDSNENGKMLWDILHVAHLPAKDDVQGSTAMLAAGKQFNSHSRFRRAAAATRSAATAPGCAPGGYMQFKK